MSLNIWLPAGTVEKSDLAAKLNPLAPRPGSRFNAIFSLQVNQNFFFFTQNKDSLPLQCLTPFIGKGNSV